MANDAKLGILIEAKDHASATLKSVDAEVGSFGKSLGGIAKGAAIAAAATAAWQAGVAAFDLARQSAMVGELQVAFDDLAAGAGTSGAAMLGSLSAAAKGTVSNAALMLAANKAMLLGVADSADEMASLMEVAIARGNAMGLSTEQAFGDLVTGIGRMSPLILDNLGIVTGGEKAFEDYAASIGTTASQLTDLEKKQALVNLAISSSLDLTSNLAEQGTTAAESFQAMDASLANAKLALGQLFEPAMVAIANQLAAAATGLVNALPKSEIDIVSGTLENLVAQYRNLQAVQALTHPEKGTALWAEQNGVLAQLAATIAQTAQAFGVMNPLTREAASAVDAFGNKAQATATRIGGMILQMRDMVQAAAGVSSALGETDATLRSIFQSQIGDIGVGAALEGLGKAQEEVDALRTKFRAAGVDEEVINFYAEEIYNKYRVSNKELGNTATAVSGISDQFDELKSKVSGVLSGALDPGVGVNPADFLPREDAVNEDARRLADVAVNGFSSPWYEYLNNKFPELFGPAMAASGGNVQQAAAQLLQDFQDGLNPELIDKEAAKERIKKMLLGDANMEALAAEITAELQAEMGGKGFTAEDIAKATGTALGTDNVAAGVEGTGTAAVNAVVGEIDGAASAISTSGRTAGTNWGMGFLATVGENVPTRLIDILTAVVTPGVWAKIQALGGLTAAEGGT